MMSSDSIEADHHRITNLLTIIDAALVELKGRLPDTEADAIAIKKVYRMGASAYLVAHYSGDGSARQAYVAFLSQHNVIGIIDGCLNKIEGAIKGLETKDGEFDVKLIKAIMAKRNEFVIEHEVNRESLGDCTCGGKYISFIDSSERLCEVCGMTSIDYGTVTESVQMFNSEGRKPKQNRNHSGGHCKVWVMRIQAQVVIEISEHDINRIKACFHRDCINIKRLSCGQMRDYLKELKISDYNHVPYIRKLLTGIAPPELTAEELDELYMWFNRIVDILKEIRPGRNITYYPYIIYKVLDHILPYGLRKAQILECIHLQSTKTMNEVDEVYKQVCVRMPQLKPKTTDKHEYELLL